jgi:hypothetical protein
VLDIASLQLRIPKEDVTLIEDMVDVTKIKEFFKRRVINKFLMEGDKPPKGTFVVRGCVSEPPR